MKTKIYINPAFSHLFDFIRQVPDNFENSGELLHTGRNEVRKVSISGQDIVVKYFKRITWANRLIYATLRKSKAQRAFENSRKLIRSGINTPMPIAFVDIYKKGLLYQSFYISDFIDLKSLNELLEQPIGKSEEGLKAFAHYSYKLHRLGIFHNDYNLTNVLYTQTNGEYDFALIDNNRMEFRAYTKRRGLKNLRRLNLPVDKLGIIGSEYANDSQSNSFRTLMTMVFFQIQFKERKYIKNLFKNFWGNNHQLKKQNVN